MPAQPAWFLRLDEILTTLRTMTATHLDRLAIEKLFRVRERRARQLMAGLSGLQVGNAFAVERLALMRLLEKTAQGDGFQWEMVRRTKVAVQLAQAQQDLAGQRVIAPAPRSTPSSPDTLLGEGIELKPGELRIRFDGLEDLAAKLHELGQAMIRDWESLAARVMGS